ncbi:TPA: transporter substrate-binding domain-containing protein, partial [Legionella pneumophila subsp. pneumophila]|nr:transporter substrate-binding domain-containing protein [Legionella pneumophila subsp. pneumophila]
GSGYGIIALKNQSALIDKINHILLEMEKDGSYLRIYNEYFGANPAYNPHH